MLIFLMMACSSVDLVPLSELDSPAARVWLQEVGSGVSVFTDLSFSVNGRCGGLSDLEFVTFNDQEGDLRFAEKVNGECHGPQAFLTVPDFEGPLEIKWGASSGEELLIVDAATGPTGLELLSPADGILDTETQVVVGFDTPETVSGVRLMIQGADGVPHRHDVDSVGQEFIVESTEATGMLSRVELNLMDWMPPITQCPETWECSFWEAVWSENLVVPIPE